MYLIRPTLELTCEGRGRESASPACDGRVSSVEACRVSSDMRQQERPSDEQEAR